MTSPNGSDRHHTPIRTENVEGVFVRRGHERDDAVAFHTVLPGVRITDLLAAMGSEEYPRHEYRLEEAYPNGVAGTNREYALYHRSDGKEAKVAIFAADRFGQVSLVDYQRVHGNQEDARMQLSERKAMLTDRLLERASVIRRNILAQKMRKEAGTITTSVKRGIHHIRNVSPLDEVRQGMEIIKSPIELEGVVKTDFSYLEHGSDGLYAIWQDLYGTDPAKTILPWNQEGARIEPRKIMLIKGESRQPVAAVVFARVEGSPKRRAFLWAHNPTLLLSAQEGITFIQELRREQDTNSQRSRPDTPPQGRGRYLEIQTGETAWHCHKLWDTRMDDIRRWITMENANAADGYEKHLRQEEVTGMIDGKETRIERYEITSPMGKYGEPGSPVEDTLLEIFLPEGEVHPYLISRKTERSAPTSGRHPAKTWNTRFYRTRAGLK